MMISVQLPVSSAEEGVDRGGIPEVSIYFSKIILLIFVNALEPLLVTTFK